MASLKLKEVKNARLAMLAYLVSPCCFPIISVDAYRPRLPSVVNHLEKNGIAAALFQDDVFVDAPEAGWMKTIGLCSLALP